MIYLLEQISYFPLSFTIVLMNTIVFFILSFGRIPSEFVSYNYDKIIGEKQIWRIVTSTFSHFSIIHILFNMGSMWGMRSVELIGQEQLGSHTFHSVMEYFKITFLLLIFSTLFITVTYFCLVKFMKWENYRQVNIVGYSGVLFGMMTMSILQNGISSKGSSMFGLNLPNILMPFMSLILTQMLIPQASFVGHLGGIVGAFITYYGILIWMLDVVFIVVFSLTALVLLASVGWTIYKNRNSITVPSFIKRAWQKITSVFSRGSNSIRNGVINQRPQEQEQVFSDEEEEELPDRRNNNV